LVFSLEVKFCIEFITNNKLAALGILVWLVLMLTGFFTSSSFKQFISGGPKTSSNISKYPDKSIVNSSDLSQIKIDVAGAVNRPGVYSLTQGSRIEDAIKIAGGFSKNANFQYISKNLNLSQKISDGQKIYIPTTEDNSPPVVQLTSTGGNSSGGVIGINSADSNSLDQLPGVGPVTAAKIIGGRPYSSIQDLLTKKVVSQSVYDKIKDQVDLN
jgi:competence protein ComEA